MRFRREWAVEQLRRGLHVSEHKARILVEFGLLALKHGVEEVGPEPPPAAPKR